MSKRFDMKIDLTPVSVAIIPAKRNLKVELTAIAVAHGFLFQEQAGSIFNKLQGRSQENTEKNIYRLMKKNSIFTK